MTTTSANKTESRRNELQRHVKHMSEMDTRSQHRERCVAALRELKVRGANLAYRWNLETLHMKLFGRKLFPDFLYNENRD
jgi:hypothetical protein